MDQFNTDYIDRHLSGAVDEIKKHPGLIGGAVFVLAGIGIAALVLNQRTGPTRWEQFRGRIDPRGWGEASGLRGRFDDLADAVRTGLSDAGERADDFRRDVRHQGRRWFNDARHTSKKAFKTGSKRARGYARDAGQYAKDHAKEGGAILALVTIAAAVAAAALETRRPDSALRRLSRGS